MHIIAVDDEQLSLALLSDAICQAGGENNPPACFMVADEALQYAEKHPVDVAFLDVEMDGMSGVELARELIALYPQINIIFVTGFDHYMDEAFRLYASGYVKKPVRAERMRQELHHLRYPTPGQVDRFANIGPFACDRKALKVTRGGVDLLLMPWEYALFQLLADNMGVYFTPEKLYSQAWGQSSNRDHRTIYTHMSRLRKKLKESGESVLEIEQKRGKGYRMLLIDQH